MKFRYTAQDLEVYAFLMRNENNQEIRVPAKDVSDYAMSLNVLSCYFPNKEINKARVALERGRINNYNFLCGNNRKSASIYISKKAVRTEVFDLHGHKCLCCGSYDNICIDHIVAVANGGLNEIENLQPLCRSCNSSKGAKTIDYRNSTL